MSPPSATRVAVVGGGITGLATAWYLRSGAAGLPAPPEVTILEAADRVGGKICTDELAGVPVEAGPDTFLARVPWAGDLCRELGLGDELVAPATDRAFVWGRGRMRRLPAGLLLGVPTRLEPLLTSGILSSAGFARAALDLALPRSHYGTDPSVAEVVGRRLGREVLERLVEPLVGGINAGTAEHLSLRSSARQLSAAAERHRSLILGARHERVRAGAVDTPVFQSVRGGLGRLVERLAGALEGCEVRTGTKAAQLAAAEEGRWRIECDPGPAVEADAVVVTVPAGFAAGLLRDLVPTAARELDSIAYASVVTATLAYRPPDVVAALDGSGFLIPRSEGTMTTACTWSTSKWPDLRRSRLVLLRASAGRFGDERATELDDTEVVARLHEELATILPLRAAPVESLVSRWPRSFPQYEPGHEARVERAERALAEHAPAVLVAGAAYGGIGIASCIRQAEQAAGRVTAILQHRPSAPAFPAADGE